MGQINTFQQAITYFESFILPSSEYTKNFRYLKLDRTYNLLKLLNNPHQKYPIIHITGTSGKGSTSLIAAAILQEAGYKVGLHTSPHLQKVTERYQVNQKLMPDEILVQYADKLKSVIEEIIKHDPQNKPSYFEILVCLAFLYFADCKVDYAVIEVGMGGRFDATNVCNSRVSILTNVDLDHTQVLGNTIEEIAAEKMMIIKPNTIAVTGVTQPSVLSLIRNHCNHVNSKLLEINQDFNIFNCQLNQDGISFTYQYKDIIYEDVGLSLKGEYQAYNAALAITAVLALCDQKVNETVIRRALSKIYFPGRIEQINYYDKKIIMDGAHNPMKMQALTKAISQLYPNQKMPILFCAKYDKDMSSMIRNLIPITNKFIITSFSALIDSGKNVMSSTDEIYKTIRDVDTQIPIERVEMDQISDIIKNINEDKILVTGSLYFVGAVRDLLHLSWNSNS